MEMATEAFYFDKDVSFLRDTDKVLWSIVLKKVEVGSEVRACDISTKDLGINYEIPERKSIGSIDNIT